MKWGPSREGPLYHFTAPPRDVRDSRRLREVDNLAAARLDVADSRQRSASAALIHFWFNRRSTSAVPFVLYLGGRRYFATANAPVLLPMAVPTSVEVR